MKTTTGYALLLKNRKSILKWNSSADSIYAIYPSAQYAKYHRFGKTSVVKVRIKVIDDRC